MTLLLYAKYFWKPGERLRMLRVARDIAKNEPSVQLASSIVRRSFTGSADAPVFQPKLAPSDTYTDASQLELVVAFVSTRNARSRRSFSWTKSIVFCQGLRAPEAFAIVSTVSADASARSTHEYCVFESVGLISATDAPGWASFGDARLKEFSLSHVG